LQKKKYNYNFIHLQYNSFHQIVTKDAMIIRKENNPGKLKDTDGQRHCLLFHSEFTKQRNGKTSGAVSVSQSLAHAFDGLVEHDDASELG
jgi:hypothetical protein